MSPPLRACLAAEAVKTRKSWHLLVALLGPLCQAGFLGVIFWFSQDRVQTFRPGFRFWLEVNFTAWNLLVMPVLAALVCDLGWELEREAGAWRLLRAQPVPSRDHSLAKALSFLGLLLASSLLLALLLPPLGLLLRRNAHLMMGSLPLALWLKFTLWSLLALPAVVTFQSLLSMLRPGLWPALGAALVGSWLTPRLTFAGVWLLPWGLASQAGLVFERWRGLPWWMAPLSLALAAALATLGVWRFDRATAERT